MPDGPPVSADEFRSFLSPLVPAGEAGRGLLVALSGGADSLALLSLIADFGRAAGMPVAAATVDHGLRSAAAEEAVFAANMAAKCNVPHKTLHWSDERQGDGPGSGNLAARARQARYHLLADHALMLQDQFGKPFDLCLAHHQDDQAETVMMRLARGSGVDGLAGMMPETLLGDMVGGLSYRVAGLRVLRPLLACSKDQLTATTAQAFGEWVEDPSNRDDSRDRVKWRNQKDALAGLGLTADRIAATAAHMNRAAMALDRAAAALLDRAVTRGRWGDVVLDQRFFTDVEEEVGLRALARLIGAVGGAAYRPRFQALTDLYGALIDYAGPKATTWQKRSLGLVMFEGTKDGSLWLYREATELPDAMEFSARDGAIWDGRWAVLPSDAFDRLTLRPLTPDLWEAVEAFCGVVDEDFAAIPRQNRPTLPVLMNDGQILALGGLKTGDSGRIPAIRWPGWS